MKNALWTNLFKHWQQEESQTLLTLRQVPVFKGLNSREFNELEKMIHSRSYKPDEKVFKLNAPGEGMYIILSGVVQIYVDSNDGTKNVLAELKEGNFFGEMSLLDSESRSATAMASDSSTLLVFTRPDLNSLMTRNPELGNKILLNLARVVSERLRKTNELLFQAQAK